MERAHFPSKEISGENRCKGYKGQRMRKHCGGGERKLGEFQADWKNASSEEAECKSQPAHSYFLFCLPDCQKQSRPSLCGDGREEEGAG